MALSLPCPVTVLGLVPLVSSTFTLCFSQDQTRFLGIFLRPEHRKTGKTDAILPSYFAALFMPATTRVLAFLTVTTVTSLVNAYWSALPGDRSLSRPWFVAGAAFAVAHTFFVPAVAPRIQGMVEPQAAEEKPSRLLSEWVGINVVRTWTTDVAAFACIAIATAKSLTFRR